jgi:hypothetical protein
MKKAALIFCIFLFSLAACKHTNSDIGTIQSSSLEAPPEKIVLLSFLCRHEYTDYEDEDIVVLKVKNQAVTGYVLVIKNKLIQGTI